MVVGFSTLVCLCVFSPSFEGGELCLGAVGVVGRRLLQEALNLGLGLLTILYFVVGRRYVIALKRQIQYNFKAYKMKGRTPRPLTHRWGYNNCKRR